MNTLHDATNATKPVTQSQHSVTRQPGESWAIPAWIEREAWTTRMLTTLQRDKSFQWYSLYDKVYSEANLRAAWKYVRTRSDTPGVDRQSLKGFEENLETNLKRVQTALGDRTYKLSPVLRKHIPKLGSKQSRPIGISTVSDRLVHTATKQLIEPIFERVFLDCSFGFRPTRGPKDALREVQSLLGQGYRWIVDADIRSFFDTIDHEILGRSLRKHIADGRVLALIEAMVKQPVIDGVVRTATKKGTPQGTIISPLLANVYLHSLDEALIGAGLKLVRYADDLVLLCKSEVEAQAGLSLLQTEVEKLKLTLHPEKTQVVHEADGSFDFLGYSFTKGKRYPRRKSRQKWRDHIVARTPRSAGQSIQSIIIKVNEVIRGVVEYFKHSSCGGPFVTLDKFVRRRLRAILLRQNHKSKTFGNGSAKLRWPNKWLAERGLISASAARAAQRVLRKSVGQPR